MAGRRLPSVIDGALFVVIAGAVLVITHAYVGAERFFYSWDHASYQTITIETAAAFRESPLAGWRALRASFHADYNAFFSLPLVPWVLVFGPSRMSYELGLALAYLVPFPLAIGAVATRLVGEERRAAFWVTAGLALLTPMTWVPLLRGFPDSGGAALIALCLFVYLGDVGLEERTTRIWLGALLGASVLFRRHFAYAAAAFFVSVLLHSLGKMGRLGDASRLRWIGSVVWRLAAVLGVSLTVLFVAAWSYAQRFLSYDFRSLYHPYELPVGILLSWYTAPYGWLALLTAAAGLLLGLVSRGVRRSAVAFLAIFGLVSVVQWCWRVRQVGEQYTLHFTGVVVLGVMVFCWTVVRGATRLRRSVVIGTVTGLSLLNLDLGLSTPDVGTKSDLRPALAARWAPLVRYDYGEVVRLVRALQEHGHPGDAVYVAASSETLNPDIVRQADRVLSGKARGALEVLNTPAVDSSGFFPLGELLEARFVVLAQPVQHHLALEDQKVVKLVYDAFLDHREIARDFTEHTALYDLENCAGRIYERQRPTSRATAVATLDLMKTAMPTRPGMQPDWAVVDHAFQSWLTRNADGSTRWAAHPTLRRSPAWTTLATVDPPPGLSEISGTVKFVDSRCAGVDLAFWAERPGSDMEALGEVRRRPADDGTFQLTLDTHVERLFLSLFQYSDASSIDYCLLILDPLVIRREAH